MSSENENNIKIYLYGMYITIYIIVYKYIKISIAKLITVLKHDCLCYQVKEY